MLFEHRRGQTSAIKYRMTTINQEDMTEKLQHINPAGLMESTAFSQVITTQGNGKTIYIGGQNAVNVKGEIVGKEDIKLQTEQVMQNIQIALTACSASFANVVKLTIYIVQKQNIADAFRASQKFLNSIANSPTVSVLVVAGLANPDFLIEIDALAFIPE